MNSFINLTIMVLVAVVAVVNTTRMYWFEEQNGLLKSTLADETERRELAQKDLVNELYAQDQRDQERKKVYYCISHRPFGGGPWTIERWWPEAQIWVQLVHYSSRTAAEDVVAQLHSGTIKLTDCL